MRRKISSTAIPVAGTTGTRSWRLDDKTILTKFWGTPSAEQLLDAYDRNFELFSSNHRIWVIDAIDVEGVEADISSALRSTLEALQKLDGFRIFVATQCSPLKMILFSAGMATTVSLEICATLDEIEALSQEKRIVNS